jgi:hypothetical protein
VRQQSRSPQQQQQQVFTAFSVINRQQLPSSVGRHNSNQARNSHTSCSIHSYCKLCQTALHTAVSQQHALAAAAAAATTATVPCRTQLQGLRDKFASAKKCPDYVDVAAQCRALCVAARTGQLRRAQQHQVGACKVP